MSEVSPVTGSLGTPEAPGTWTATGWSAPVSGLTVDQAERLIAAVDDLATQAERQHSMASWWLADLLCYSEDTFGDKFSQITPDPTKNRKSYLMLMRIARAFPERDRRYPPEIMSIWAHGEVYNLEAHTADELLESYATGELTRSELRHEAQELRAKSKPEQEEVIEQETDTCPLCVGAGHIGEHEREIFLEWMATREEIAG